MKRPKRAKRPRTIRAQQGQLPGEQRRRSLVAVEGMAPPGANVYGEQEFYEINHYIVVTQRLEQGAGLKARWRYEVEYHGERWLLPGKVVDQMLRHRESIIKDVRSANAIDRAERIAREAAARTEA